jgi:hypothetical protein
VITTRRPGDPVKRWYMRAIRMAASVASDPELTKNVRVSGLGSRPAIRRASKTAGAVVPHDRSYVISRDIWLVTASITAGWP